MEPRIVPSVVTIIYKDREMEKDILTERQNREIEYHKEYFKQFELNKEQMISNDILLDDVIFSPRRRWWNGYWSMYTYLLHCNLKNKKVLIVGCGLGKDAFRISKLGADVYAFDISPEIIAIAKKINSQENLKIEFQQMSAENLQYESNFFDYILANDILHHVDIPQAISEIVRVAKKDAVIIIHEIYTHSYLDKIRYSKLVTKYLYPAMQSFVYQTKNPYITKDERKMSEKDIQIILEKIEKILLKKYFYFLVKRIFPDKYIFLGMLDKILLSLLFPLGFLLAGRILLAGKIKKN